ncbi:MAG: hypothetical protein ABS938_00125 [Psychrobacillus psychrodurans]
MRTIQSELLKKGLAKTPISDYQSPPKKIKENFSEREIKELMGCNKNILVRGKGGAYKQR